MSPLPAPEPESPTPAAAAAPRTGAMAPTGARDSLIAVLAFVVVNRLVGLGWAIVASTGWSLRAAVVRRRRGLAIGKLLPVVTAYLVARGLAGLLTGSTAVFFGIGIATQAAIGVGLVASVVVGRALLRDYAHLVLPFPDHVRAHPLYRSTMVHLTLVAGAYQMAKAGWDLWLYNNNATVEGFVMLRFAAGWVTAVITISVALVYADLRLRRIERFDGLMALLETVALPGRGSTAR